MKPQHEKFAALVAAGEMSGTQAYLVCYPKSSLEAARRSASDLLMKPDIEERVTELREAAYNAAVATVAELNKMTAGYEPEQHRVEFEIVIGGSGGDPED